MKSQQSGFAHAFLIIGLVVALIGALGFVFWQNFIYKEPVAKTESAIVAKKQSEKSDAVVPAKLTPDKVNTIVENVYKSYISERKNGTSVTASLNTVKNNFTEDAYVKLESSQNIEALTCAANYVPDSISLETKIEGNNANSEVTRVLDGQTASARIQVVTDLTTGKISAVNCPY